MIARHQEVADHWPSASCVQMGAILLRRWRGAPERWWRRGMKKHRSSRLAQRNPASPKPPAVLAWPMLRYHGLPGVLSGLHEPGGLTGRTCAMNGLILHFVCKPHCFGHEDDVAFYGATLYARMRPMPPFSFSCQANPPEAEAIVCNRR